MLKLFIRFELEKFVKYFKTKTLAKAITAILFVGVFVFVGLGIYAFFVSGFRSINFEAVEDIRLALTLFLYELFLVVLAGIIIFSAMVSGLFNLFRGGTNNWLISSPGYKIFPKVVFARSMMNSLLPLIVMFIPAICAFNHVYHLGLASFFFISVSFILLLALLTSATLLSVLIIGYIYYTVARLLKFIPFTFKGLVISLLLVIACFMFTFGKEVSKLDLVQVFKADIVSDTLSVQTIQDHFMYLPTHPIAMEILYWQNDQSKEAMISFGFSFVLTVILVVTWFMLSSLFYPLWQRFQEGKSQSAGAKTGSSNTLFSYQFKGSSTAALFKKEALVFTRDYKGILWFLFLFFIWLVQIGANKALGRTMQLYEPDISKKLINLETLQFIIAVYFMCSFTLRFAFPSFSVEKKTAWILASAPLSFKKIFYGKYFFFTSFFFVLGMIMSYISSTVLSVPFTQAFNVTLLFAAVVVFVVTLGLSIGAIFPSYETDDPEAITTSMPGLFFTGLSLLYGALASFVLYVTLSDKITFMMYIFMVATLVMTGILLYKTPALVKDRAA
jgi:ABC-2 type transport system permease protein